MVPRVDAGFLDAGLEDVVLGGWSTKEVSVVLYRRVGSMDMFTSSQHWSHGVTTYKKVISASSAGRAASFSASSFSTS